MRLIAIEVNVKKALVCLLESTVECCGVVGRKVTEKRLVNSHLGARALE